jgi:predicted DNA-binding protein
MKRFQIFYPEEKMKVLKTYAKATGRSVADVLREAGDAFIARRGVQETLNAVKRTKSKGKNASILDMIGMFKNGPTDASINIDDIYLPEND